MNKKIEQITKQPVYGWKMNRKDNFTRDEWFLVKVIRTQYFSIIGYYIFRTKKTINFTPMAYIIKFFCLHSN